MNNNSEQINRYLHHEMTTDERIAFEERLSADKQLQQELHAQQLMVKAAVHAGIKEEFAKAMKQEAGGKTYTMKWLLLAAASIIVILVFNFKHLIFPGKAPVSIAKIEEAIRPFIDPPLSTANVPFTEFSFDAEKGDTFFYHSGSILCFPPASLVDASGTAIKGKVRISYREFKDPVDFFVSGIPMAYDSGGVNYNFESSGMCEINAYQNDKPVFISKTTKPEIHMATSNADPAHNLYYLDTAKRRWEFIGKDRITKVTVPGKLKVSVSTAPLVENESMPVKPVMPAKASDDQQSFSIEIVPGSFEELFVYDGLKFQVVNEKNYDPSDAQEHWDDVKLERTPVDGIYTITFTNSKRSVSYKVRPVLEGADYDNALKIFNQKNIAYQDALRKRLDIQKDQVDSVVRLSKQIEEKMRTDKDWNDKMNRLIIARNKKLNEVYKLQKEAAEKMLAEAAKQDSINNEKAVALNKKLLKENADINASYTILRSYSINQFGTWNCDNPTPPRLNEIPVTGTFFDSSKNSLGFSRIAVVYKDFNGIMQFYTPDIRVVLYKQNMIWAIKDGTFYYYTYQDFAHAFIDHSTSRFNFHMRSTGRKIESYSEIKELVESL